MRHLRWLLGRWFRNQPMVIFRNCRIQAQDDGSLLIVGDTGEGVGLYICYCVLDGNDTTGTFLIADSDIDYITSREGSALRILTTGTTNADAELHGFLEEGETL